LVVHPETPARLIPVRDHPAATQQDESIGTWWSGGNDLWCLTTTTRRIPCLTATGYEQHFADWEEIPEGDDAALQAWYTAVWTTLNPATPVRPPTARILDAEAGFSPDCQVACRDWRGVRVWRRIMDVRVGDTVYETPERTTTVVGVVTLAGDQSTDAVTIPGSNGAVASCATWFWTSESHWSPFTGFSICELHPTRWHHLYTEAGSFMIAGGHRVRDASDVGLDGLRPLVEEVVLSGSSQEKPSLC
jgi:hypothetical protein